MSPAQIVVEGEIVIVGVGRAFTVTVVVPIDPVHPETMAETEYVPEAAVVTLPMVGFCDAEVKLLGPVQEYVLPVELAVKLKVFPEQTGVLLPADGVDGV